MLVDGSRVAPGTIFSADICVVGAGVAGITLARALLRANISVALLESGNESIHPNAQALSDCKTDASFAHSDSVGEFRVRALGGAGNLWAGLCRPLDPSDFEPRDWVSDSGWPLRFADLLPWFRRAEDVLQIAPFNVSHEGKILPFAARHPAFVAGRGTRVEATPIQYSDARSFGARYRGSLQRDPNAHVILAATVVDIRLHPGLGAVRELTVRSRGGQDFLVRARHFVLAGGGIENPRLLLAARSQLPAGIGNGRDVVGRYFHEHPTVACGVASLVGASSAFDAFKPVFARTPQTRGHVSVLMTSRETQAVARTLNFSLSLFDPASVSNTRDFEAPAEIRRTASSLARSTASLRFFRNLVGSSHGARPPAMKAFALLARVEQAPVATNRITLDRELDPLGVAKPRLHWRLSSFDRESVVKSLRIFAGELGRFGQGHVQASFSDDEELPFTLWGHHMGATRMGNDPGKSVVDSDCRVFGIDNLFVAGSSVFPTGGFANPTFTIVALALRLAEHLKNGR